MIHRLRVLFTGLAGLFFFSSQGSADVLHLKGGGRLEGILLSETGSMVTIDVGMGRVSVPRSTVRRIERKEGALSEYRNRLQGIPPGDVEAFAELARFAGDHGLNSEARLMWARVASLDPRNVEAHLALGHVLVGGTYVDEEEAYRARGYVLFDGRWMTTAEQASLLRQREQRAADERRNSEARRAAREAEDRDRRAAAASRARAEAAPSLPSPVWGYGGPVVIGSRYFGGYSAGCPGRACLTVPQIWTPQVTVPVSTRAPRAAPLRPSSIR